MIDLLFVFMITIFKNIQRIIYHNKFFEVNYTFLSNLGFLKFTKVQHMLYIVCIFYFILYLINKVMNISRQCEIIYRCIKPNSQHNVFYLFVKKEKKK